MASSDFNGDGRSDVLWRNTNGQIAAWFLNNNQISSTTNSATVGSDWQVVRYRPFQIPPNQPPIDIRLSNNRLNENVTPDTRVGILSTIDPDLADTHTYSLVRGQGVG